MNLSKTYNPVVSPFKGVIFDLDGTLLNTLRCIGSAFNQALKTFNYPEHPFEDYAAFIGDGVFKCAERALPSDARSQPVIDALVACEREIYDATWQDNIEIYDGIPALLRTFREGNVPTAVLTNKDQLAADICLETCFPEHRFEAVIGYTGAYPHKPHPACGNVLLDQLQLAPRDVMMLGDTSVDIHTARACKLFAVGVSWGFRTRHSLEQTGCDLLIDHPSQLLPAIQSMSTKP